MLRYCGIWWSFPDTYLTAYTFVKSNQAEFISTNYLGLNSIQQCILFCSLFNLLWPNYEIESLQ